MENGYRNKNRWGCEEEKNGKRRKIKRSEELQKVSDATGLESGKVSRASFCSIRNIPTLF
jgi:hypothetical protein